MEHFIEIIAELLFGLAKDKPDKMPENISYNPCFTVRHPVKKTIARIIATLIGIGIFSVHWIFVDSDTRILYIIFIVLLGILLMLSLMAFSFRCYVTEKYIYNNYWGMFSRRSNGAMFRVYVLLRKRMKKVLLLQFTITKENVSLI